MISGILDNASAADYLGTRGWPTAATVRTTELSGGVSGVVLLVEGPDFRVVVKQALPRLRVAALWEAAPARAQTEAAALRVLAPLGPDRLPTVLDDDPAAHALVMTAAPADWVPWKDELLAGAPPERTVRIAAELGGLLGTWHRATRADGGQIVLDEIFLDLEPFEQLRLRPFHLTVAQRHPDVAPRILELVAELRSNRDCLVDGDFSPKNVLVGEDGWWVLDLEVAHLGAPVFDLAFLLCHLILKAVHRPVDAAAFHAAGDAFLDAYAQHADRQQNSADLAGHTACLLLARVDGLSPAGYLTRDEQATVRNLALDQLRHPERRMDDLWAAATG